ncbi:MAG: hypothetical protein RI894_572 [Bacteroidota bacterium]
MVTVAYLVLQQEGWAEHQAVCGVATRAATRAVLQAAQPDKHRYRFYPKCGGNKCHLFCFLKIIDFESLPQPLQ